MSEELKLERPQNQNRYRYSFQIFNKQAIGILAAENLVKAKIELGKIIYSFERHHLMKGECLGVRERAEQVQLTEIGKDENPFQWDLDPDVQSLFQPRGLCPQSNDWNERDFIPDMSMSFASRMVALFFLILVLLWCLFGGEIVHHIIIMMLK